MEGMNQMGQEEYIWAMRTSTYRDSESELYKQRRSWGPADQATRKSKGIVDFSEHQTKVMASLVPDEVIYNVNDYSHRFYDACFLFGDVSGFTELCEKYTKVGISGPSRMTQVLNKYLGSMVQEVLSHNGDVLKFSGDAFLAMFKSTESETMRDVVHEALDCALVIQKNYGSYLTDVGVVIKVKLAVSAGVVTFALIGDESNSHYVVVGKPIWDVKTAESISSAGDIIVAPAAWHYVNTNEYHYQSMPDGIHYKITGVGPNWRSVQKAMRQQKPTEDPDQDNMSDISDSGDSGISALPQQETGMEEFSLRPAVNTAPKLNIKDELRKFIISPVMKSIEMDEPFEYLTEMRQAVVCVINVVSIKLETRETVILADQAYKVVCSAVNNMKGCVNKVSLFDKDLMFVVIFGLRGLKHELECQVALRCATECHHEIRNLPNVISCSIGVTTGKTYCGVFGHTLRREYTVISLIVNKAARLMCAYKNKVTCDRETFLHSKLEARNFILQPPKPLKGISHPGPVYEFKEAEISHGADHKINACPLVGREDEMKLYQRLLEKCFFATHPQDQQYKMLLIQGDARQGKTRLLEEMIYTTPAEIPVSSFSLRASDSKIPYQTIRLLFNLPLSLTDESTSKAKEDRLLILLKKMQVPDLLCLLNNVFGVNFDNSELYLSLSDKSRKIALRKIMKQLCYACFITMWVIAIDNCEFIDEESWDLFDVLFDITTLFVVATKESTSIGCTEKSEEILKDVRVKTVYLKPIERAYLGALACQILDVYAISPELEKAIQSKSNGNPGWIESFLIGMIQDEMLYVLQANLIDINDLGLVCPPVYMMTRLNKQEKVKWQHIMEERRPSVDSTVEPDFWRRYIDSCRDSYLNVTIREQMESISIGGKVPVCVISPNFKVADDQGELSMDAMILKTFDSLNFFEQLLVKCSAILGNQFLRGMLCYVMSSSSPRQLAKAVQKLFEIKVLTCAKGDFVEGVTSLYKERLVNPADDLRLRCECKGITVHETCTDLPRYASCGYMQFRSSLFREITYNLLTDNQKKEFHHRAIRYLERETRRCKACGNGYFERLLGPRHDKDFLSAKERVKNVLVEEMSWEETTVTSRRSSLHSVGNQSAGSSTTHLRRKSRTFDESKSFASNATNMSGTSGYGRDHRLFGGALGISIINRLKNSVSFTRAFSAEDFTDCQCSLILNTTYAQLIDHAIGAGNLDKELDAMVEYSYICIISCNIPLAMRILDASIDVLKLKAREKGENMWKLSLIRGKIYTLIGHSRLELGQYDEALRNLHKSLTEYGIRFPTGFSKKMRICANEFKQLYGMFVHPRSLLKHMDHWETVFANNLSECLSHLCTVYMCKHQWDNAKLTATWSFKKAVESFSDFRVMCTATANMICVAKHFQRWRTCVALEVHSLRLMHLKRSRMEAEDMKAVAMLYGVIFDSRILRSSMEKAIHIGYIVLRLCSCVRAVKIILPLLPQLVYSLLINTQITMALSMLQELDFFADEDTDSSGRVWYFALCMCFHLETGYTIISYDVSEDFYQLEGESWVTIRDPDATKRYYTVMWLWCIRTERWEDASLWCLKTDDFMVITENDSLANKITALYLLEGMLLFLVSKLDKRNVEAVILAESEIKSLISALERAARTSKMILARLYHMKAYFRYVKYNDHKVNSLLDKAKGYAKKYGNTLEMAWIDHSLKAWTKQLPGILIDFWKEHTEPDNVLDFHELELDPEKIGFFSLPTPLYI